MRISFSFLLFFRIIVKRPISDKSGRDREKKKFGPWNLTTTMSLTSPANDVEATRAIDSDELQLVTILP